MRPFFAALAFFAATTAYGQVAEFSLGGGKSLLSGKELGGGYTLDDGFRMVFRLTINNWRLLGQEFGYAYNRTSLEGPGFPKQGMAIHQGFFNMLAYATPEGSVVRPFATGGVHFSNFVPPGSSATQGGGQTKFGVNYGGGVKVRVGEKWQVRVDLRQFLTGKPFDLPGASGKLRQTEISLGLGITM